MLLPWPWHPLLFTAAWDVIELLFFLGCCIVFLLACILTFVRTKSWATKLWIAGLVVVVSLFISPWAETMCFSVVQDPPRIDSVPELSPANADQLESYHAAGLPVVLRGVLNDTVPMHRWTPTHLREKHGNAKIKMQLSNVEQHGTELTLMRLGEFLERIEMEDWVAAQQAAGKVPYFAEHDTLFEEHPELGAGARQLLGALNLTERGSLHYQTLFWIGPAGTLTGLHYDIDAYNVLYQMYGTKTVWLYPIWQSHLVYPSPKYDFGATLAEVDHFNPDYEKFPEFAKATPIKLTINAGDALFVPSHWYHAVRSESASVSVSVRLFSMCEAFSLAPLTLLQVLHEWGLYRKGDCVCHSADLSPY